MTTETITRCALGISSRTLSDFRSDGLGAKEMERLRQHVAQCGACQERLDAFETMAGILRGQHEPNGHALLWQDVRASITAASSPASIRGRLHAHDGIAHGRHGHSARFWTAFGSLAAVVLSIGFVALFASHGVLSPTTTKTATPQVIRSGGLTWRQVVMPKGYPVFDAKVPMTYATPVAASDGNTMYACLADKRVVSSPRVWVTRDAGQHWSVITPPGISPTAGGCYVEIDANDPSTLIASFFPVKAGRPDPALRAEVFASFDGGASWGRPAGLQDGLNTVTLASAQGKIYAIRVRTISDLPGNQVYQQALYVSRDHMQSWTQTDNALPEAPPKRPTPSDGNPFMDGKAAMIWVNPLTGAVLSQTRVGTFWLTRDDGAHWQQVAYPGGLPFSGYLAMATRVTDSGVYILCASVIANADNGTARLFCSYDEGATWKDLSSPKLDKSSPAIGPDGSIYTLGVANPLRAVLRLAPGVSAADWQPVGTVPNVVKEVAKDPISGNPSGYQQDLPLLYPTSTGVALWFSPGFAETGTGPNSNDMVTLWYEPDFYVATYP